MGFDELLQKTVLTVDDIMAAHGTKSKQVAYRMIREMKNVVGDRLKQDGKIHILDYCKFYHIDYYLAIAKLNGAVKEDDNGLKKKQ